MKRFAAGLYFGAGVLSVLLCWQGLMMAVWGAPTHWTQYVGLVASLALVGGSISLFVSGEKGQLTCAIGIVGMAFIYVPAAVALVPVEDGRVVPLAYLVEIGYLLLAASGLFFPRRLRGAPWIVFSLGVAMVGYAGMTACVRWRDGVFNRPRVACFLGALRPDPLIVPDQFANWFTPSLREQLTREGLGGSLAWCGAAGDMSRQTRLMVIATEPVRAAKPLPYPKQGTIVYLWDGRRWSVFPEGIECYPAYATLQPDGMISITDALGGEARVGLFPWPRH